MLRASCRKVAIKKNTWGGGEHVVRDICKSNLECH